jgi:4-aminobutyrate aminotransferase
MIGVEMVRDRASREGAGDLADALMARAADLGLLILTSGPAHQVIRWIPPLDVTSAEVTEGLEIFGEALRTV